jgi:hypothetical protein
MYPNIKKAKKVNGAHLVLRDASVKDAEFILDLRIDPIKSRYLSTTSTKLEDQISWLKAYQLKKDQAYFIICDKDMNRLGCVRIYGPIENSYCWGSWLMIDGLSPILLIESVVLVYAYGKYLGFDEARISVRKENEGVWSFHEKFSSAELVDQTEIDYFYVIRKNSIESMLKKYAGLLTNPLEVEPL